jgi:hypothetical protein
MKNRLAKENKYENDCAAMVKREMEICLNQCIINYNKYTILNSRRKGADSNGRLSWNYW